MKPTDEQKKLNLYLFNLSTDQNDPILNFGWNWITEFSNYYQEVFVFTTHKGEIDTNNQVKITELDGGTCVKRIKAVLRLMKVLIMIMKDRNQALVFHHMSVNTAVILGLPLRLIGVKQGLWYSHSANNWKIRLSTIFVSTVFSSSESAFPIRSKKVCYLGHGVPIGKYFQNPARTSEVAKKIVSIGRITPIKKLENIINAIAEANILPKKVTFIGPTSPKDEKYLDNLINLAKQLSVELEIIDQLSSSEIPKELSKFGIFYTGTPKSTDKAAIEAAISGCYVISENADTRELVGMEAFWNAVSVASLSLKNQIEAIYARSSEESKLDRHLIQKISIQKNNLSTLIQKITISLANQK